MQGNNKFFVVTTLAVLGVVTIIAIVMNGGFGRNISKKSLSASAYEAFVQSNNFAILGGSTITNTGNSVITGDLGLSPGTSITGFLGTVENDGPGTISGNVHQTDQAAADAQTTLTGAYTGITNQSCTQDLSGQDLGGLTLTPGVYCFSSSAQLTGTLTLNAQGNANSIFIFKIGSTLTTASGSAVVFTNNVGSSCNVFWQVASSATLGSTSSFKGNILALTAISTASGSTIDGRLLAGNGAVTLINTAVAAPVCVVTASAPMCTLSASPTTIVSGNSSTLSWTTTDATTFSIDNSSVTSVASGTNPISPIATTTYTGTATGAGGSVDCTATVTVTTPAVSPILTLAKIILNGGPLSYADFPLTATDTLNPLNFITGINGAGTVTNATVTAGSYTLTEPVRSNYTAGLWICTNGGVVVPSNPLILADGSNTTCTVINTYYAAPTQYYSSGGGSYTPPIPPLIDLVKIPNPLSLPSGSGPVTYTYTLRNIGTVPVTDITVVDNNCSPINYISGDTNADKKLDMNETWTYNCSKTLSVTETNIATATGWANGISATDITSATVVVGAAVLPPLIHVTKIPNPLALLTGAGMVTYTEKITNPGTVALGNVHLTDDKCSPVNYISGDTNNNTKLDPSETWTYTCQMKLLATTTNTATATGEADGLTAKDFAIATVVVTSPTLPKSGFPPLDKYAFIKNIIKILNIHY